MIKEQATTSINLETERTLVINCDYINFKMNRLEFNLSAEIPYKNYPYEIVINGVNYKRSE